MRSNRISQNLVILLKNKTCQLKTKTRFSYDGKIIITEQKDKVVQDVLQKVKEDFKIRKTHSYIKPTKL